MKTKFKTKDIVIISVFAAIICVISTLPPIPVPGSPVPITTQTLVIFIVAIVGEARIGTLSVILYCLLGTIGLPVFTGGSGGISVIMGPTGGYIIGFIFAAYVIGKLSAKNSYLMNSVGILIGVTIIYSIGTIWLSKSTGMTINAAFKAGSLPFIIPDITKGAIAIIVGNLIKDRLKKEHLLS